MSVMKTCYYDNKKYKGYYVDINGRVFSDKRGYLKEIVPFISKGGYKIVTLSLGKRGKTKHCLVSRLVANTFIPVPQGYYKEVDHINTNKLDNTVCNLCWTTRKGNHNNPITKSNYSKSKKGINNPNYNSGVCNIPLEIHYKKVLCIENNEVFPSISAASKKYNIQASNIGRVCRGERKKAGGYTWKYIGGDE